MTDDSLKHSMVIQSKLDKLADVEHLSEKVAGIAGLNSEKTDNMSIAVTEAVNNAIVHGNKSDTKRKVFVDFVISKTRVTASVRDQGNGFDPNGLANPVEPENILKESGRGIFILKALMSEVKFSFKKGGTEIIMIMNR